MAHFLNTMDPRRTCIGCRQTRTKSELIRWSWSPSLGVKIDLEGRLPGRGGYTCLSLSCWEQALKGHRLNRVFRKPIPIPSLDELAEQFLHQSHRKIGSLLRAAREAGQGISGKKVLSEQLKAGQVRLLLMTRDIAEDLKGQYLDLCRKEGIKVRFLPASKRELGTLLGDGWRSALGILGPHLPPKIEGILEGIESFTVRELGRVGGCSLGAELQPNPQRET